MSVPFRVSPQMMLDDFGNVIFSLESEDGLSRSNSLGGRKIALSGPEVVPASPSLSRALAPGSTINGISGLYGFTSSASADLTSSLVSRLKARLDTDGSTLFTMTWKERATPSHRSVCLLRARARSTSGNECGSWPTPLASDTRSGVATRGIRETNRDRGPRLCDVTILAHWPTCTQTDAVRMPGENFTTPNITLNHAASWATPSATDFKGAPKLMYAERGGA